MRAAIIGGGVMGEAILGAALEREVFAPGDVVVCEVILPRAEQLEARYGVAITDSAEHAMNGADLVVLSVKPQDVGKIKGMVPDRALLLSIMAGVRIATIAEAFGTRRIVRVMPNTPVAVREGMCVWTATPEVDEAQREATRGLLSAIGRELYVDDEKKVDMATALSGSGPAYVFLVMEAMVDAGVAIGLTRAQAAELVEQTVLGSAAYARESDWSLADLRAMVTSPAGTTAAGLLAMERGALRATIVDGVRAAHARAIELGEGS